MNSKILSVLSAAVVALAVSVPASIAKPYNPAQFNAELKKLVGKRTGVAAYTAAARFYSAALTDRANKRNAAAYASSITAILRKQVSLPLQFKASQALISSLQVGYFSRGTRFNLNDPAFTQAVVNIAKFIPISSRTTRNSQLLYNTMAQFATTTGKVTRATIYDYYRRTLTPALPVPPVS